jgi:hypothetical protein
MTYATDLPQVAGAPSFDYAAAHQAPTRARNANVGYVVFAFGALWAVATAAVITVAPVSLPQCQVTALGDIAGCAASASVQAAVVEPARPGLDVSGMAIPASLSGSAYDAF